MSRHTSYAAPAKAITAMASTKGDPTSKSIMKVVKLPAYTSDLRSEFVNSLTHGIGVLFGIAAIPLLTAQAVRTNHLPSIAGACVYGFSFLLVFTFSTIYHGLQQPAAKKTMEVLDHISIYYLIAGTYTPFILAYMNNQTGITMLWVLWGLALAGTIFKICCGCKYNIVSTIVYLLMGWMLVWTGGSFFKAMPAELISLIIAGGILYSLGVVFFLWERWRWHHAVWHVFVLFAAICHYAAVLMTVINGIKQ